MSSSEVKLRTEKKGNAPKAQKANMTKPSKEKKAKVSKVSSSPHPPYFQMIKEAILALHERTGSSPHAISKYMEEKHKGKLPANFRKVLAVQLRNLTVKGKVLKVKASFKLSDSAKQGGNKEVKNVKSKIAAKVRKPKVAVKGRKPKSASISALAKKKVAVAPKKPAVTAKAPKKAVVVKKAAPVKVKKAAPVKPKQPKSIKSPAAKRAKKAAA